MVGLTNLTCPYVKACWKGESIFPGGVQRRHFAYLFKVATLQCKRMLTKRFTVPTPQRKCPMKVRALFPYTLKYFSSGAVYEFAKCVLSVIRYRFCWIGAYSHNWVWNGLELLTTTFTVFSLVCAGWTELTSEIFCPNCFLQFAYQKCFFFS